MLKDTRKERKGKKGRVKNMALSQVPGNAVANIYKTKRRYVNATLGQNLTANQATIVTSYAFSLSADSYLSSIALNFM